MKYQEKEILEAVKWDGTNFSEKPDWLLNGIKQGSIEVNKDKVILIGIADGEIVFPGDYIVKGYGRIFSRHSDVFEHYYKRIEQ